MPYIIQPCTERACLLQQKCLYGVHHSHRVFGTQPVLMPANKMDKRPKQTAAKHISRTKAGQSDAVLCYNNHQSTIIRDSHH